MFEDLTLSFAHGTTESIRLYLRMVASLQNGSLPFGSEELTFGVWRRDAWAPRVMRGSSCSVHMSYHELS